MIEISYENCGVCPAITEKDSETIYKLRRLLRTSNNIIQDATVLLTGGRYSEKIEIVIKNYLNYCSLFDSDSIDILSYRLLFALKDSKAMCLYRKNIALLMPIKSAETNQQFEPR